MPPTWAQWVVSLAVLAPFLNNWIVTIHLLHYWSDTQCILSLCVQGPDCHRTNYNFDFPAYSKWRRITSELNGLSCHLCKKKNVAPSHSYQLCIVLSLMYDSKSIIKILLLLVINSTTILSLQQESTGRCSGTCSERHEHELRGDGLFGSLRHQFCTTQHHRVFQPRIWFWLWLRLHSGVSETWRASPRSRQFKRNQSGRK